MTHDKSLLEMNLEAYRNMFQAAGDFVEGSIVRDLWNNIPGKGSILKGEINVTKMDRSLTTHNIITNSLELVVFKNRFYLYWDFTDKNFFLINKPQNDTSLETLSKLAKNIRETFEQQVTELVHIELQFYNEWVLKDNSSFFDIAEEVRKRKFSFSTGYFYFKTKEIENIAYQLFGDWVDHDLLLGLVKKYNPKEYAKLTNFCKAYDKKFRKVVLQLEEKLGNMPEKEFQKIDAMEEFRKILQNEDIFFPTEDF